MLDLNIPQDVSHVVDKVASRKRISAQEAMLLWEKAPLSLVGTLADCIKREKSGQDVYFNRNFHIEPTNICAFNCKFCSYRRGAESPEAWNYSLDEIERIAIARSESGATEVHIVGGVHPAHDLDYYIEMISRVKAALPGVTVKAFTAVELAYMINKAGISFAQGLGQLKQAGMEAIPGGGAEIFADEIRRRICAEKGTAQEWLALHEAAHNIGISTNATILYGHIEDVAHRIDHMLRLRDLQDRTGGFNAFIPLKYRSYGNSLSGIGEVPVTEDLRMLALSRIFLDNFPHIKAYWPMYGKVTTGLALAYGADDIDGTIEDTTRIYSMAGAEDTNPAITIDEIRKMAAAVGMKAVERDTFYNPVENR